jgi:uncharacterized membrane protein
MGHWHKVPSVRSGDKLTFGERAADKLKAAFGSWSFIILLNAIIVGWIVLNAFLPRTDRWDLYPFILLNLGLSWLAAQQGGALQIAANRGDRISSEVALHTYQNGQELLGLNKQQLEILGRLDGLQNQVAALDGALADQSTQSSVTAERLAQHGGKLSEVYLLATQQREALSAMITALSAQHVMLSSAPSQPATTETDTDAVQAANSAAEVKTATATAKRRNGGARKGATS